jgi:hypothetical protein
VLKRLIDRMNIQGLVKLCEPIEYKAALAEMMSCSGLLLLQSASCNHQIPAKVYEYIRARRPILALTDKAGDTARLLRDNGLGTIAQLDSVQEIQIAIRDFLSNIDSDADCASEKIVEKFSRRTQVAQAARMFDDLIWK